VDYLFYLRLIGLTAGTLVYLFLIALILGHRRPRLFERLLFFLMLSLFLVYAGGLLEINARLQYGTPSEATRALHTSLMTLGEMFLPGLLVFTVLVYSRQINPRRNLPWACYVLVLIASVAPIVAVAGEIVIMRRYPSLSFAWKFFAVAEGMQPIDSFLLIVMIMASACESFALSRRLSEVNDRRFFQWLTVSAVLVCIPLSLREGIGTLAPVRSEAMLVATIFAGVLPGAILIYFSLRHNFLEFGAQRNLVYALSGTFLALLYLALVRRVSGWLEGVLPPEATASILLFVLIFLFEPLERVIGPALHRAHQARFGRMQKLAVELQERARHGELEPLVAHAEQRIRVELGLAALRISIPRDPRWKPLEAPGGLGHAVQVPLVQDGKVIGLLEAASTGSYLTGETTASLEFLAEQLPAMVDLCRLIEEKLRLERELAERERLALLGQMAASVSHNLRNPLSSMKTVLQVQLENPNLPVDVRRDCALVVTEIDRMNAKLTQLLHFAKPSVNGHRAGATALAKQTAILFRHDAERRNVRLEFDQPPEGISVMASEDALSEVLSNLIVNAIEAQPNGGRVRVGLARHADRLEILVEDDGPGISQELRSKIFQPFFTTKATGTGLGLSIVARRVAEMGGTIACESPLKNGKGTRFRLTLPLAEGEAR